MPQQTAVIVEQASITQADFDQIRAASRDALDEVLTALTQVAIQRDDDLLAMATQALRQVHDLYGSYSPAALSSTTTTAQARRDIHATISRALRENHAKA